MKLAHDTIVLVVDGARMLLLRNHGDAVYPDLRVFGHQHCDNPPDREQLSDAPGLSFSTGHPGRNTHEENHPHEDQKLRFATFAAAELARAATGNTADLIVVAPPDILGTLRRHYDRSVTGRLVAEIGKDLTRHPVAEITRLLAENHG